MKQPYKHRTIKCIMDISLLNIKESRYYKNINKKLAVWVCILIQADHVKTKGKLNGKFIECKRGQVLTSRGELSRMTRLNDKTVERMLDKLGEENKIVQQKTFHKRLITILNYEDRLNENVQPDCKVSDFIEKCKGVSFTDDGFYHVLVNFKKSVINDYIDKHSIFEESLKNRLRSSKEKKLKDRFYDEIMPYLETLSENRKKQMNKDKYNKNRREKAKKIRQLKHAG